MPGPILRDTRIEAIYPILGSVTRTYRFQRWRRATARQWTRQRTTTRGKRKSQNARSAYAVSRSRSASARRLDLNGVAAVFVAGSAVPAVTAPCGRSSSYLFLPSSGKEGETELVIVCVSSVWRPNNLSYYLLFERINGSRRRYSSKSNRILFLFCLPMDSDTQLSEFVSSITSVCHI